MGCGHHALFSQQERQTHELDFGVPVVTSRCDLDLVKWLRFLCLQGLLAGPAPVTQRPRHMQASDRPHLGSDVLQRPHQSSPRAFILLPRPGGGHFPFARMQLSSGRVSGKRFSYARCSVFTRTASELGCDLPSGCSESKS